MKKPRWTPEDLALLKEDNGATSDEEMGLRMGRSTNAITTRRTRLNIRLQNPKKPGRPRKEPS